MSLVLRVRLNVIFSKKIRMLYGPSYLVTHWHRKNFTRFSSHCVKNPCPHIVWPMFYHQIFLKKCQIQTMSENQWQIAYFSSEFKLSFLIGRIVNAIIIVWIFWLLNELRYNVCRKDRHYTGAISMLIQSICRWFMQYLTTFRVCVYLVCTKLQCILNVTSCY